MYRHPDEGRHGYYQVVVFVTAISPPADEEFLYEKDAEIADQNHDSDRSRPFTPHSLRKKVDENGA